MDRVQLPEEYRDSQKFPGIPSTEFPINSWHSFDRAWNDEWLSQPWSYLVGLSTGHPNWEYNVLSTRPFFHNDAEM